MTHYELLRSAPHEFDARLIYHEHGLAPFFAFESIIRQQGGSARRSITFQGEDVDATLYYQDSGIGDLDHPDVDVETIREFRIKWTVKDDVGERSGNFHIAPRTPAMRDRRGRPISIGWTLGIVGISVTAKGSNLPFKAYEPLFVELATAFGVNRRYFEQLDDHRSRVVDAARYVRVRRDLSGPIHAVDGVLSRIAHVLQGDRSGYRKHVADDTEAPGYYHTATIGPDRAAQLVDGHRFAKEFKHYLPRVPDSFDENHPLYHPKVEVAFQSKRQGRAIPWVELEALDRELDEALLNVLRWEGFPVAAEGGALEAELSWSGRNGAGPGLDAALEDIYVDDAYFKVEIETRSRVLVSDPTPRIKDEQQSVVIELLRRGWADSDYELIAQMVSDGGRISPNDAAEATGRHLSTIYRAIDRLEGIVVHDYGEISLRSPWIAEELTQAVDHAQDVLASTAGTAADALAFAADELQDSSIVKWLRTNGVDVDGTRDGRMLLRFGAGRSFDSQVDLRDLLERGYNAWVAAGRDRSRFREAEVRARVAGHRAIFQSALPG